MLDVIGNLTTLRNDQDLLALALRGWSGLGHGYISFKGAGVAIARTDSPFTASDVLIPIPGNTWPILSQSVPDILFYAPNPNASDQDLAGTYTPNFPYTLAGWAYATPYNQAAGDGPISPIELISHPGPTRNRAWELNLCTTGAGSSSPRPRDTRPRDT